MSSIESYTSEVHAQTHRYATWLPTEIVTVGTVGYLEGTTFTPLRQLTKFGISANVVVDPNADAAYTFTSDGVNEIGGSVSSSIPTSAGTGAAKLTINFSKAHSLYFALHGCVGSAIDDLVVLGEQILKLVKTGAWKLDFVVVTRIITAASATILQSEAKGAAVELEATATTTPLSDLLKIGGGAKMVLKKSVGMSVVTAKDLTPLLGLAKVNYTFFDRLFGREPSFPYVPSRRSIRLAPFTAQVSGTPHIDLAADTQAHGELRLNVRVPRTGEYVDIGNILELTAKAAPARVSRSISATPAIFGVPARMPKGQFLKLVDEIPNLELEGTARKFIGLNVTLPKTRGYVGLTPLVQFAEKASKRQSSEHVVTQLSFEEIA
jgi:hypothetical protein